MGSLQRIVRLYHTAKYLKLRQIVFRIWNRVYDPAVDQSPHPARRSGQGLVTPVVKPTHLVSLWEFTFLGVTRACRFPADWNNSTIEKLWLYNLHYFDDLQSREAGSRQQVHSDLLLKWIAENSPGEGNGWEPYPISLRLVNWIKWALAGNVFPDPMLQSLAIQTRILLKRLEYHLLGNHLFANGKALIFAGLFFAGAEAEKWQAKGLRIIEQQLAEQIFADGGHFERSPMYHEIILEDLLDLINIMVAYGVEAPDSWRERAGKMLGWLSQMCHPDGEIALFNDAALGIGAQPEELRDYAGRLGIEESSLAPTLFRHLAESGYVRWQDEVACVIMDVGEIGPDFLPGHAHADTLSFEMSLFGERFIVDSGTSCYGLSEERLRQRGTQAHNTVSIEQMDSSEVWSGFRVARRARPFDLEVEESGGLVTVSCSHDGFCRKRKGLIHRRTWELAQGSLRVKDMITAGEEEAIVRFHFHPAVELRWEGQNQSLLAVLPGAGSATLQVFGGEANIVESTYHPHFGASVANSCLTISMVSDQCETVISW